jgi:molecular chaperone DnaK (HSP70)
MNIGIDLGSSNTVVATVINDGTPIIIPDYLETNMETTPSLVFLDNKKAVVGNLVNSVFQKKTNLKVLSFFKRYFGTNIALDSIENKPLFSESIAAILLKKVIFDVKMFNNESINSIIITVPSHYDSNQRNSVLEAAKLAGIELSGIIDEPIAAALYYLSESDVKDEELILVYDLGGGTFDLSVITFAEDKMHVIAKGGISNLGGKEFDEIIINMIKQNFAEISRKPIKETTYNNNLLREISEKIKLKLNKLSDSFVEWLYIDNTFFPCFINKNEYDLQANELILKTEQCVLKSLRTLGLSLDSLQKIILIGGASSSKLIFDFWQNKISSEQKILYNQPLTSVAKGAAIHANSLNNRFRDEKFGIELKSVSTYNIGIKPNLQGKIETCILKNSPLPCFGTKNFKIDNSKPVTKLTLCRFFDLDDFVQDLGEIIIDHDQINNNDSELKLIIENKEDGTLGINIYQVSTDKKIKYIFKNFVSKGSYNFDEQLQLLNQLQINNVTA